MYTRNIPQNFVVTAPVVASRHGHEKSDHRGGQSTKASDQLFIVRIQPLLGCLQSLNHTIGEHNSEQIEDQRQNQQYPNQRKHRIEDRKDHHPQLSEELQNSNDPQHLSHTDEAQNACNTRDSWGRFSRRNSCHDIEDDIQKASPDDEDVKQVPVHVLTKDEVHKARTSPAQNQIDGEQDVEDKRNVLHDIGQLIIDWMSLVRFILCSLCKKLGLDTDV
mmetsp:Transcript_956/g.1926  ORF Transcript_956/g.1926 Transcript_956/m.1926 type:complete len:219 (-) Transcript_956:828-1484(-)